MRTSNPALNDHTFADFGPAFARTVAMTVEGTVVKTGVLLGLVLLTASFTWAQVAGGNMAAVGPYVAVGAIGGLITCLITVFKPAWAAITGSLYALFEGLMLGAISKIIDAKYPGIAIQAVGLTFGTLACLLVAYRAGIVRATEKFKLGVIAATGAIFLVYLLSFILGFFVPGARAIFGSGVIGIGFSLVVVVIAALNLVLDFDFIEQGAARGAPKYMEWYGAFALMVTLIWLYLEILRLLAKLRSRD